MKIFLIIFLFITSSCSFDDKSGIWTSDKEIVKKDNQFQDFETLYSSKEGFKEIIKINKNFKFNISPPVNNLVWNDIFYNETNNFDNFEYKNKNKILLKSKKLSNKITNEYILQQEDKIILSDEKGDIIIFSLNEKKVISKFNFYKKKIKNVKKNLNIIIEKNIIFVSDNIGYLYAYDFKNKKILWAKNLKVPFRSNLKIYNNILIAAHQNNDLHFFNKTNGEIIKLIPTEENIVKNEFINNLAISENNLFYLNTYGSLYSINMNNLNIEWFLNLNESLDLNSSNLFYGSEIVIKNNKLLVSSNQFFYILDLLSGSIIKKKNFTSLIKPQILNDYAFLITKNKLLICIDLKSANMIYSYDINKKILEFLDVKKKKINFKYLFIINNEIFLILDNSFIVKLNLSGSIREITKLPSKAASSLIFTNKSLKFLTRSNRLIVLN